MFIEEWFQFAEGGCRRVADLELDAYLPDALREGGVGGVDDGGVRGEIEHGFACDCAESRLGSGIKETVHATDSAASVLVFFAVWQVAKGALCLVDPEEC